MTRSRLRTWALLTTVAVAVLTIHLTGVAQTQRGASASRRFIVVAKSAADVDALRADIATAGGRVLRELPAIGTFVVSGPDTLRPRLQSSAFSGGVAADHIMRLVRPAQAGDLLNTGGGRHQPRGGAFGQLAILGDPAFGLDGLLWSLERIEAPQAWKTTMGSVTVKVGVADTGLDFTHSELSGRIMDVVDFTTSENPPICKTFFGFSDVDLAASFGGPKKTDWNGHGTWIGGNIAAALDTQGVNGIAPKVGLVALKISQWCGSAYDSEILDAFLYAADHDIDVVNISFGGYLDRADPDQDLIYKQYVEVVRYAQRHGTVIVAAAGNEHVRVGTGGKVLSHGSLTTPGDPVDDLFGLYETPGGIPGVVNVSATGNYVNSPSFACAPGTIGSPTDNFNVCKPRSDAHQAKGVGEENQLSYFSNYGPRIDVAAPGGARKFNLPGYDRGGTPGFPYTDDDDFNAWESFSITSNWAVDIPCFLLSGAGFPDPPQCYSSIQGTSMAAPHAAGVLALIASANPRMRHDPAALIRTLKSSATNVHGNRTQVLSATDTSPGDLTGIACADGYCHLGGQAVSDGDAYGAGLINAKKAVH